MRHILLAGIVIGTLAVSKSSRCGRWAVNCESHPQLVKTSEIAVAPPPRAVEDSRISLDYLKECAWPADNDRIYECNGVEWRVKVKIGRLLSTGKDTIEFHWKMKYSGPRPPLNILIPSLMSSWPKTTEVRVYAFPLGTELGRMIKFQTPEPEDGIVGLLFRGALREWYMTIRDKETESGIVVLAIDDIKTELRSKFPSEFSGSEPPILYVRMIHQPEDRGQKFNLDAWTGVLITDHLQVDNFKKW
ncbi:MAG: hypothetical protein K8U57_29760 [Planctomycetes bacterium]|nr:hypothetical protein [Planctomycetota bacterium]